MNYIQYAFITFILLVTGGCFKEPNNLYNYLKEAEVQYETDSQKKDIIEALEDSINLPPSSLEKKLYSNYRGELQKWNLITVIEKYFVPNKKNFLNEKTFYKEVKSLEGQKILVNWLKKIKK